MSAVVQDWVWHECPVEDGRERFVLLAIARHCSSDDGTGSYPSQDRLARMVRADVKTVRDAIKALELANQLIVWRPTRPSKKDPTRYAVVMGREPDVVRTLEQERHRPSPVPPGAVQAAAAGAVQLPLDAGAVQQHETGAVQSYEAGAVRSSSAGAVQPSASTSLPRPAGAVRRPSTGPGRVQIGSRTGPGPVQCHAQSGRRSEVEVEEDQLLQRRAPGSAPAAGAIDGLMVRERIAELRRLVVDRAPSLSAVAWNLTTDQAAVVAAQVDACGAQALADEAVLLASGRGAPRSVRAWLTPWEIMLPGGDPPPAVHASDRGSVPDDDPPLRARRPPPCGECDAHVGGVGRITDEGTGRVRPCPLCHPTSWQPAPF